MMKLCECGCGVKTSVAKNTNKKNGQIKGESVRFISGHHTRNGNMAEENHPQWQGDNISYYGVHRWVERRIGKPKKCEYCGLDDPNRRYEWANISGKYKRDLKDYKRLCVPCHKIFDENTPKGEKHYQAKLDNEDITKIRRVYVPYKYSFRKLAEDFNVSLETIFDIIHRRTWKHI